MYTKINKCDNMNGKHLIIVSLLLAILTMCAVSASDDVSGNLTVDDTVEIEAIPADDVVSSNGDSNVISSSEGSDVVSSSEDSDVLSDDNVLEIYINDEDDIRSGNDDDVVVGVYNGDNRGATGLLTVLSNGTQVYSKTITIPSEETFYLSAKDLKNLPLGQSLVYVSFYSEGTTYYTDDPIYVVYDFNLYFKNGDTWELLEDGYDLYGWNDEDTQIKIQVSNNLNGLVTYTLEGMANTVSLSNGVAYFTIKTTSLDMRDYTLGVKCQPRNMDERERTFDLLMRPYFSCFTMVEANKEFPIGVILPKMYSGSFRVYNYNSNTGTVGSLVKQTTVTNGRGTIMMNGLSTGYYDYYLVFESTTGYTYSDDVTIRVNNNNPNIRVSIPTEVYVGSQVTVSTTGPLGTYDVYVDGLYRNTYDSVTSFRYVISNLGLGTHTVNVLYDYEGDFQYNGVFKVNVKTKPPAPAPIKLTLKKAKIKKSKKLVLSATLKQGNVALKGKKITFKFKGKTYKAKTNAKGVAKVTIKKSVLKKLKVGKKVTVKAIYGSLTSKFTAKVSK